jgi:hypothetical protein
MTRTPCDGQQLFLAAREQVRRVVRVPGQPVPLEHLGDAFGPFGRRHTLVLQAVAGVLGDRRVHDLRVGVLEDEAHPAAHRAHLRAGVEAVDEHAAGRRHDQPVEQPREGALARSVRSHDADAVLGQVQVQPVEDEPVAVGLAVDVAHAEEFDAARRVGGSRRSAPLAAQSHGVAGTRRGRSITG